MSLSPDPRWMRDPEWLASLRNPLARIELAASRLARDAHTPSARDSVEAIREAVADLDRQVGARGVWERGEGPRASLAELLQTLEARLRPVLEARGISIVIEPAGETDPTPEAWRARRAGLALLRSAARCDPTQIAMRGLCHQEPPLWGIEVVWTGGRRESDAAAVAPLRQACADCGAALEFAPGAMRLWFDEGPPR